MKIHVTYNQFNTDVEKAEIITEGVDEKFSFQIVEDGNDPSVNVLELSVTDGVNNIALSMNQAQAKQFNLLLTQMLRQL